MAFATGKAVVYDFEPNSVLTVIRVQGTFANSANIIGNTSGAIYPCYFADDSTQVNESVFEDDADNIIIQQEADGIIDFTEQNPFGEP